MRGEEPIDPARRAASARNRGDNLRKYLEPILEPAVSARLHDTEQICLPHTLDHVVADAAVGLGLLRLLTREDGNGPGARQEIGSIGFDDRRSQGTD